MSNGSEHIPESSKLAGATTEPEPNVESNPGEFAAVWNRKSEDERAEMLHNMRVSRDLGERCWFTDHERQIAEQRSRIAALEAVIEKVRALRQVDWGMGNAGLDARSVHELLAAAPSTVLDQVIREAKAEALREVADEWVAGDCNLYAADILRAKAITYRNGDA